MPPRCQIKLRFPHNNSEVLKATGYLPRTTMAPMVTTVVSSGLCGKVLPTRGLKSITSQFWGLEVQNQGISRAVFLPSRGSGGGSLGVSSSPVPCHQLPSCPSAAATLNLYSVGTWPSLSSRCLFQLITSATTLFQRRPYSEVLGVRITLSLGTHNLSYPSESCK